jgi:flagellar biosynthesis/type III secretory pathway protein FliH
MSQEIDNAYTDGFNEGKAEGRESGYNDGITDGFADGKYEAEQEAEQEISSIRNHYQGQISDYRYTIKCLKQELHNLRKEYATITRTISKST